MTAPAPVVDTEVVDSTGPDETLSHWFCRCSPDLAFCGWDVSEHEEADGAISEADLCLVCADFTLCPRCLGTRT